MLRFQKLIVILGPTASGKSELAVRIAKKFDGEVVSADSRQVYKHLDIGSAKVPKDGITNTSRIVSRKISNKNHSRKFEKAIRDRFGIYTHQGIPHHLIDVASPKRTFTVARYQKLGHKAIRDIVRREKLPIIAGGTGLYIDSLLYGTPFPEVKPDAAFRKNIEKKTAAELFRELKKRDPTRAKTIDPKNKRRLIRALEIIHATGSPVPSQARKEHSGILPPSRNATEGRGKNVGMSRGGILMIGIAVPREVLKTRIEKRFTDRLHKGLIEEVKNLHENIGLSWQRLDDFGLEYRFISRYLRDMITREEMEERIVSESMQYAKRQLTWWKRDKDINWTTNNREAVQLAKNFLRS